MKITIEESEPKQKVNVEEELVEYIEEPEEQVVELG